MCVFVCVGVCVCVGCVCVCVCNFTYSCLRCLSVCLFVFAYCVCPCVLQGVCSILSIPVDLISQLESSGYERLSVPAASKSRGTWREGAGWGEIGVGGAIVVVVDSLLLFLLL